MIIHKPVLLNNVLMFFEYLKGDEEKIFVDFTVGFGGHSKAILQKFKNVKLIAFDRDEQTLNYAKENLKEYANRINFFHKRFSKFNELIDFKIDGALLDLGVNSMQLLDENRGFSFNSSKKLDMRMDKSQELSAYEVVNYYPPHELERVFRDYAEIKYPGKIVKTIINARQKKKIETCKEFSDILNKILKRRGRINPSTKFFQAIRIEVNDELKELESFLEKIWDFLNLNARIAIISFHSLEDRIVKNSFKREGVKILTKKPIRPDFDEIKTNPRARSAKLRVSEWAGI